MRLDALKAPSPADFAVVCISAYDQADELTTLMLTQLLERAGHPTLMLTAGAISEDILAGLAQEPATVVVISALPPFAFAQVRVICQTVRAKLKTNRIIVGLWNTSDEAEEMSESFGSGHPDFVVRTLAEAMLQVESWRQH